MGRQPSQLTRALLLVVLLALGPSLAGCQRPSTPTPTGPVTTDDGPVTELPAAPPEAAPAAGEAASGEPASVDRIIDGDSLRLRLASGVVEVRLLDVNAPELHTLGNRPSCNGERARDALTALLAPAADLRFQPGDLDRYGRRLGRLFADGQPVGPTLVARGWALALWSAGDPVLTAAMEQAADARLGLWGDTCGAPAVGPVVGEVQPDPPGRDEDHLDQEWIELVNPGPTPLGLDGWAVTDDATSNRFRLSGVTIAPGATLRIVTGRGTTTPDRYYLGRTVPVWSNRGETVLVLDPEGRVAAHRFLR